MWNPFNWVRRLVEPRARDEPKIDKMPTAEDFTPGAIEAFVFWQTFQHPMFTGPAAVATLATFWSLVVDASPQSVMLALGAAFVGGSAWAWNYLVRGEKRIALRHDELRQLRAKFREQEGREIERLCDGAGCTECSKEAAELRAVYERLRNFLMQHVNGPTGLTIQRYLVLAEDTYTAGLGMLRTALSIHNALQEVDVKTLEKEVAKWKRQRDSLQESDPSSRELGTLNKRIKAHEDRITLYYDQEQNLKDLLAEVDGLEKALESAHLGAADLIGTGQTDSLSKSSAGSQLEAAISAARSVEEKLRGLSNPTHEDDNEYLRAGQSARERK